MSQHPHPSTESAPATPRQRLEQAIAELDHLLPGQAPILNFVHHNTLHGYQHLPMPEALEEAEKLTGIRGFLPEADYRRFFQQGRILAEDLDAVLTDALGAEAETVTAQAGERRVPRREIGRIALLCELEPLAESQLDWRIHQQGALARWQPGAEAHYVDSGAGPAAVRALWDACLAALGLQHFALHPEELTDLSETEADAILARFSAAADHTASGALAHQRLRAEARAELDALCDDLGGALSLRGWVLALSGEEALDTVRPILVRFCANFLDEGLAAWHSPHRAQGLYSAWRATSGEPAPDDAIDALLAELRRLGIPTEQEGGYLRRLALELPGWSGIVNWRQQRPDYPPNATSPVHLADYLAIRILLDRQALTSICREQWNLPPTVPALRGYFERNLSEFWVRRRLFQGRLPEYLALRARQLLSAAGTQRHRAEAWRQLADMGYTYEHSAVGDRPETRSVARDGWRLFVLAQQLGLTSTQIETLGRDGAAALLAELDRWPANRRAYLWLCAYERRYREEIFAALASNRGRGRWARRDNRPEAQIVFCMDEREEGLRRHLEELDPNVETLGAAGFFGLPISWRSLDSTRPTPQCPVNVNPVSLILEVASDGQQAGNRYLRRLRWLERIGTLVNQEMRRNLFSSQILVDLGAPFFLARILLAIGWPALHARLKHDWRHALAPKPATEVTITTQDDRAPTADGAGARIGLTTLEQATRIAGLLRAIGLTSGFAPLIVIMGHGSHSENNPHHAAHDCGACGGRHGGPNARIFAAIANRPEVRAVLSDQGIDIPEDCWFVGAQHNTCTEEVVWFDLERLTDSHRQAANQLRGRLADACALHAMERCRRLMPTAQSPRNPLRHLFGRAEDYSQARPEFGHATNAAAVVGRRSLTQGAFWDRRIFLISYDPRMDRDGQIVESILLTAGPVGAGINLEYYFSSANREQYGCGTKVTHNVAGFFGVMDGASGDLRTGLPIQMTEIHEPMRLLLIVEQTTEVLGQIYDRQPALRELIANEWIQLASLHPETGELALFVAKRGFVAWTQDPRPLAEVERSAVWYQGHREPRPPALIRQPEWPTGAAHA